MNTYTIAVTYVVQVQAPDDQSAILEALERASVDVELDPEVEIKGVDQQIQSDERKTNAIQRANGPSHP